SALTRQRLFHRQLELCESFAGSLLPPELPALRLRRTAQAGLLLCSEARERQALLHQAVGIPSLIIQGGIAEELWHRGIVRRYTQTAVAHCLQGNVGTGLDTARHHR